MKVTIEVLRCFNGHDVQCVAINDLRVAGGTCCGRWKTVRRWEVDASSLLRDLKRAGIEVTLREREDPDSTREEAPS